MPRFLDDLEATRRRGYAIDREEHMANSCCVATTIFDGRNRAVGAIGVSGRNLDPLLTHLDVLRQTAELISHKL